MCVWGGALRLPDLTGSWGNLCSCPLTPVVSKASAGAMEVMDVFATTDLAGFLKVTWDERGRRGDESSLGS